jgi:hypothetical protein
MALPVSYAFPEADGDVDGAKWTTPSGGYPLHVTSHQVDGANATNSGWWSADSFGNDHYAEIKLINRNGNIGPTVRMQGTLSALNCYKWYPCSSWDAVPRLFKCINNSFSQIGSDYPTRGNNGDTVRLSVSGSTITPSINSVGQGDQSDTSITSGGAAGIHLSGGSGGTADDFVADNVGGGPPPSTIPTLMMMGMGN